MIRNKEWTIEEIKQVIRDTMDHVTSEGLADDELKSTVIDVANELTSLSMYIRMNNERWNINPHKMIRSHRRLLGRYIVFLKKVIRKFLSWYITPLILEQNQFNESVTNSLNEMEHVLRKLNTAVQHNSDTHHNFQVDYSISSNHLTDEISNIQNQFKELDSKLVSIHESAYNELFNFIKNVQKENEIKISTATMAIGSLMDDIRNLKKQESQELDSLNRHLNTHIADRELLRDRIMRLERRSNKVIEINSIQNVSNTVKLEGQTNLSPTEEFDYFAFEQLHRGSREEIKNRQRQYLTYFEGSKKILDIGCGRGEFLELLAEEGKNVYGIDIDEDMVEYCRDRGFLVDMNDGVSFLREQGTASFDAIIMAQVVEHLEFNELVQIVAQASRCLRPRGVFIIETINPESLIALANWYFLDPTHKKPIHPEMLSFLLESKGFADIQRIYLSPPSVYIPKINSNEEKYRDFNQSLDYLNGLVYGHQDYAIVARR